MIRKLIAALLLLAAGGALTYWGLGHHIVRSSKGTFQVPKIQLSVSDTYADIRDWEAKDFAEHPDLTRALVASGHEDLVPRSTANEAIGVLKDVLEGVLGKGERE